MFFLKYIIRLTAGLKWAPDTFENIVIFDNSTNATTSAIHNNWIKGGAPNESTIKWVPIIDNTKRKVP